MPNRPGFNSMWTQFATIYGDGRLASVGKKIGGKVEYNIELGLKEPTQGFENGCAIRMSYALNRADLPISRGTWKTVSGADGRWYIYKVRDMIAYLRHRFGKPDKTVRNPTPADFKGLKGVLVFDVNFNNATGHATLWDGASCSDHCYFPVALEASLWKLA